MKPILLLVLLELLATILFVQPLDLSLVDDEDMDVMKGRLKQLKLKQMLHIDPRYDQLQDPNMVSAVRFLDSTDANIHDALNLNLLKGSDALTTELEQILTRLTNDCDSCMRVCRQSPLFGKLKTGKKHDESSKMVSFADRINDCNDQCPKEFGTEVHDTCVNACVSAAEQ